jgi:large subunit ribosomal protein L7/L12
VVEEKTTFEVILEDIASDKRVAVLKVIRNLTSLGLKEAKRIYNLITEDCQEGIEG